MSVVKELSQKYTPVQMDREVYKSLSMSTPDFVLYGSDFDPNSCHAFLEYDGKVYYDPAPGTEHVELAQKSRLPENWHEDTVQGRVGRRHPSDDNLKDDGGQVVSFYPYQLTSLAQVKRILRQIPGLRSDCLLVGVGGVYWLGDVLGVGSRPERMQDVTSRTDPGRKWWAPNSESFEKRLKEILG